jgi:hypothetical protein
MWFRSIDFGIDVVSKGFKTTSNLLKRFPGCFEKTGNVHRRTFSPALALALALASGSANGSGGTGIAGNANYPQPTRCPCVKDARNTFPLLPRSQGTAKFDGSGAPDNLCTERSLSWRKP